MSSRSLPVLALATGALALHLSSPDAGLGPGHLFSAAGTHQLSRRMLSSFADVPAQYKNPPQAPPVWNHTAAGLIREANALTNKTTALYDDLVARIPAGNATFENTFLPIVEDDNYWATWSNALYFYSYVSANEELRDASTNASAIIDQYSIEAGMREDIFRLVDNVFATRDTAGKDLDPESRRLVERTRKGYISSGLAIPAGEKRDRFKAIRQRLSELELAFGTNMNEENGGVWFTREELVGVPADVVGSFENGTGVNEGKLRVTHKYPDLNPVMRFATNPVTRRKLYISNENRTSQNAKFMKETVVLRDEAARLLGYPNHATLVQEDRMAKNPATVNAFLGDLRTRLMPGGKAELQKFLDLKKADLTARNRTSEIDGNFYLWDLSFYNRLILEKDYEVDQFAVAEYFPVNYVVAQMLTIFEELMGFTFVELGAADKAALSPTGKAGDLIWHEDVIFFSVWDSEAEGGAFVGYLYLDLHPRQGKYGHAANFNLQAGYLQANGSRHYPATALVCNLSKPTATRPGLLRHDEVVTLFHELGHGIHDLSGRTRYSRFHGTRTVRDFVEAPSQMLENWCWTPSVLRRLSSHFARNESIPDALIAKLIATKHVNEATTNLRQIHYGQFDMALHTPATHADAEKIDPVVIYNEMRLEISGMKGDESTGGNSSSTTGSASFNHVMSGYDAGYYGYLWSQVYSTDMFVTAFAANPMNSTVGIRYRRTVLQRGGSRDETVSLTEFLGRPPNSEAFYREMGLSSA